MTTALPDAMVSGYEALVEEQDLPDPDDRHVLAAALTANAALLVTANLDDFPAEQMPAGLSVVSPDGFVVELMNHDLDTVVDVVVAQAAALASPPMSTRQLLDGLEEVGLVRTVAGLRSAVS